MLSQLATEPRLDVVIGTQPSGQGHETSFAQVVADGLGLAFDKVQILLGDTDVVMVGGGEQRSGINAWTERERSTRGCFDALHPSIHNRDTGAAASLYAPPAS